MVYGESAYGEDAFGGSAGVTATTLVVAGDVPVASASVSITSGDTLVAGGTIPPPTLSVTIGVGDTLTAAGTVAAVTASVSLVPNSDVSFTGVAPAATSAVALDASSHMTATGLVPQPAANVALSANSTMTIAGVVPSPTMLAIAITVPPVSDYSDVVFYDSPVAFYRMQEEGGLGLLDYSGHGHHGRYFGFPGSPDGGGLASKHQLGIVKGEHAVDLVDTGAAVPDYDPEPHDPWFTQNSALTLEAWVRPQDLHGSVLIGQTAPFYHWALGTKSALGGLLFFGETSFGATNNHVESPPVELDRIYHVVYRVRPPFGDSDLRNVVDLIVNDQLVATRHDGALFNIGNAGPLFIGAKDRPFGLQQFLRGTLSDVAFYDYALSDAQVAEHYTAGRVERTLLVEPTADVTLLASADVVADTLVPSPTAAVRLVVPVPTDLGPANGRIRDSYAVATWDPPIVEAPAFPFDTHAYVSADAYTSVTMTGTRPTIHGAIHAHRVRHRDRIVVAGHDITFWRGVPTPIPSFGLVEPLLYGSGSLELPQVVACFEHPGMGALSWLVPGAPVQIQRVKDTSDGPVVITDWRGILLDFDTSGRTLSVGLAGDATGRLALMDQQPPIFRRRADLGYHWWDLITDVHRPFHPAQGPDTGITLYGAGGMSKLDYAQQLSANGVQVNGTQWTCMPTEGDGTYRVIRKDTTTIDATAYLDDAMTVATLRRDPAEEPNRVFATGVTPGGRRVKFGVYPVLADNEAPVFLGNLHPGDTGDNVTALLVRLYATGYLTAADRPGGYDADATAAVKELQDDAGLPTTGSVNLPTWEALFSVGVTGYNINGSHIEPAAQRDNVRRYLRDAAGNVIGQNPNWDRHALVVDKTIDMGTGKTHQQMHAWSRKELAPTPGDPGPTGAANNWVGRITFNTGGLIRGHHHPGDPLETTDVMHARDLRPGMNIWLPRFDGGTLLHVSGVDVTAGTGLVSATVDTQARDSMKVWEVIDRNVESRRDPARAWMQSHRSSRFVKDAVTEFDEVGGTINDIRLPGGWKVFPVVAGQEGTIARLRLTLAKPAEFVVVVTGAQIGDRDLAARIGDPLAHGDAKHWDADRVRRAFDQDFTLLYVAGDDQAPCGYYPGQKRVKTWTPQVPNPHYNVAVDPGSAGYDNRETIPLQVPNPNYNPADPNNDQEFMDVVRHDELTPLTGRWDDDAGFGYRTADSSCVLWVSIYTHHENTLTGGRIMWPQLEAGS